MRSDSLNNVGPATCSETVTSPAPPPHPTWDCVSESLKSSVLKALSCSSGSGKDDKLQMDVYMEPREGQVKPWQPQGRARTIGQVERGSRQMTVSKWAELTSRRESLCVCAIRAMLIYLPSICTLLKIPSEPFSVPALLPCQFSCPTSVNEPSSVDIEVPGSSTKEGLLSCCPTKQDLGL